MMKYIYTIILYSLFINLSFSQTECELNFKKNFFNSDIIGYYLTAIDLDSGESNMLLFDYELELIDQGGNCQFPDNIKIKFDISIEIPSYTNGITEITSGDFYLDFTTADNISSVSFKNTDLTLDTKYLPGGVRLNMDNYDKSISDTDIDELSSLILGLGRLPNGKYYFNFEVIECGDELTCDNLLLNEVVEVFLPSYLNLVSPGTSNISDSLSTEVFIPNPIFQWSSDYCSNCSNYSIRICEYNSLIHNSLEDAINSVSILPITQDFYDIGSINNIFQYPISGAENLLPGSSYVWQVKRSYETTQGTYDEYSDIFIFKMKNFDTEQQNIPIALDQDKLEFILSIIGESKYNELFINEDSPFYNFTKTNSNVKVNGEDKTFEYLMELLSNLNIEIIEVDYE